MYRIKRLKNKQYVIQKGFRFFGYPIWFSLGHPEGPEKTSFIIDKYDNFGEAYKELERMNSYNKELEIERERSKYRILTDGIKFKIQKKGWFFYNDVERCEFIYGDIVSFPMCFDNKVQAEKEIEKRVKQTIIMNGKWEVIE